MNIKASAVVLVAAGLLFVLWCYVTPARDKSKQVAGAIAAVGNAVRGPQPVAVKETVTVEPRRTRTLAYEFPRTPGRLYGSWGAKGISAKIQGASNDTLVAFKLIGPNNETLQNLDHPTSGNFDIRITSPGRYTFVLDNGGIVRSSSRVVSIDATYQAE